MLPSWSFILVSVLKTATISDFPSVSRVWDFATVTVAALEVHFANCSGLLESKLALVQFVIGGQA